MRIFRWILRFVARLLALVILLGLCVGVFFGVKGYFLYKDAVDACSIQQKVSELRSMPGYTTYDELPPFYVDAVIAVEDHRFESHIGIDFIAIGRAVYNDVKTLSFAEGGSTITQQLAKNLYFTQEKKLERKFAEMFAAFALEREYEKDEILELYVNSIYFGSGYYGIHDAAQGYYGKLPSELSDYECAMLAGLPNAPSAYSPDTNPTLAQQRLEQVLRRMVDCEMLSQSQADEIASQSQPEQQAAA